MAGVRRFNVPLPEFLQQCASKPFLPGTHDCVLMACDWVKARTGVDPAKPWRGAYADRRGALKVIARAGGLPVLAGDGMARAGLSRTDEPILGDVGVVRMHGETVMAIRTVIGWVSIGPSGLVAADSADVLAAWSV